MIIYDNTIFVNILSYLMVQWPRGEPFMKPLKEKVCITLDNDLLEKLRKKAEYDDRSLSSYINLILRRFIEEQESK